ncbi:GFA family protein [Tianweitania sediminis]|uniref:GFA family protein n=1 Tax=Tianweitania sediminis TaxID=1502156 RepID=A0A8J7RM81_9HYPH|nr:GFA family protein [Tianweitania sediminis]MBP0439746.1 GFA family protein [Tianweitania sediminis]
MSENNGACLCGGVRIRTHGELRGVVFCHCSQCRRQTGLYYAATDVADEQLEVQGSDNITWFEASAEARRGFCKICGSALFWKRAGSAKTSIMAGLFDQPSGLQPAHHIFVADKGDFYKIEDDLPRFPGSNA